MTPGPSVAVCDIAVRVKTARVEFNCPLKVAHGFFPASLTPLNVTGSPRISGDYLATSGVRFPVQPVRHRSRGIHYKDDVLVRGVLRRHLGECEMLSRPLLPLTLTAQEYGQGQRSKTGHEPLRGRNRPVETMDRALPPGSANRLPATCPRPS